MDLSPEVTPGVSVVICTFNGASRIPMVLGCLSRQEGAEGIEWEVVVVDNGSTDDTSPTARRAWISTDVALSIVHESKRGITHARLKGVDTAKYEYISFIDDDNFVDSGWVATVFRVLQHDPEVGMCGGLNEAAFESSPPPWFEKVKGCFAVGPQGEESGDVTHSRGFLFGAGLSMRKSVFLKLQDAGFQFHNQGRVGKNLGAGDDSEMTMAYIAAGYRLWYSDQLKLTHFMPDSRMKWEYARGLFRGLGESELFLNIFRARLKRKPLPLLQLYAEAVVHGILYSGWRMATFYTSHRGNPRYLLYLLRKHYILKAMHSVPAVRRIYREIDDFCCRAGRIKP